MADEVNVPGAGPVKRQYVIVGVSLVGGILVYAYWKRARSAGPAGVVPAAPADAGAPVGGSTTPGLINQSATPPDPSTMPPATAAEWTRRAIDYMQSIGYDPQLVAGVLGKYLARQPLTPQEQDIVRTVEGVMGKPPGGQYAIIPVPNPPAGGGTPPPPPSGGGTPPAAPGGVGGLHGTGTGTDWISAAWDAVAGATGYHVIESSPYGRTDHGITGATSWRGGGLAAPDTDHRITVRAVNAAGEGPAASVIVHTTGRFSGPRPPSQPF